MFVNTSQQLAEKKLLLLYIFDKLNQPVSNSQITQFILENDLMNYFMLQQFLSELKETKFITEKLEDHTELLSITEKGKNTLNYFINRIPNSVKEEINQLISEKKLAFKKKSEVTSHYVKVNEGKYQVKLSIIEENVSMIDLKFTVDSIKKAQEICEKWQKDASNIYRGITNLFS